MLKIKSQPPRLGHRRPPSRDDPDRALDLAASRIGLLHAVAENPAKFQKLRDRRLYVRKWLHNERAKRPV